MRGIERESERDKERETEGDRERMNRVEKKIDTD